MATYPLANVCPCQLIVEPYVMSLSNSGERMMYPCDVGNKCCIAAVLDLPNGTRKEMKCMYTSGMNPYKYFDTLSRTLFDTLFALGSVRTPQDKLVVDLVNFVVDSTIHDRHVCPKDGPALLPVAYIHVAPMTQQPPPPPIFVPQQGPSPYYFGPPQGPYFGVPQKHSLYPQGPYVVGVPQQQQFATPMIMPYGFSGYASPAYGRTFQLERKP